MTGVLAGIKIIEMAGIGPGPFAGMMLADHGADVIRVERIGGTPSPIEGSEKNDVLLRSRSAVQVDLKSPNGQRVMRHLAKGADGLIEGFRPGVMERLGIGPDELLAINPALVFGRMTGWGQDGPKAALAGHDINYLALSGTLHMLGRAGKKPAAPINLLGDYAGGGLLLAFGMCAALLHAQRTGHGQVVDCAMIDGAALLASMVWSLYGQGHWEDRRGTNLLDGGAHFYDTYETSDGKFVAVGAIEPQFYRQLRDIAGLSDPMFDKQFDSATWQVRKERLAEILATRTRDDWCRLLENTDACVTPVLSMAEAPNHPHNAARKLFHDVEGVVQPAPAPRFSGAAARAPATSPSSIGDVLERFGLSNDTVRSFEDEKALILPQGERA